MRRQSCFEATDIDGSRTRASTRRSLCDSPPEGLRHAAGDQIFTPAGHGGGASASAVTISLLAPTSGGCQHPNAADTRSVNDTVAGRSLETLDVDGCLHASAPLLASMRKNSSTPLFIDDADDDGSGCGGSRRRECRSSSLLLDQFDDEVDNDDDRDDEQEWHERRSRGAMRPAPDDCLLATSICSGIEGVSAAAAASCSRRLAATVDDGGDEQNRSMSFTTDERTYDDVNQQLQPRYVCV